MMNFEDDEMALQGGGLEPSPATLAHWAREQYVGDDRFEGIEIQEPGATEEETVRVKYIYDNQTCFFIAVLNEMGIIRIGLASENRSLVEAIEEAAEDNGDSLTEFIEMTMEGEGEFDYEVCHFHDDMDYFCSDIPFQCAEDLDSENLHDEIIYYLDGFMSALYEYLEQNPAD